MLLDERDIALSLENRIRQLRAEKHLGMTRGADEQAWGQWSGGDAI
jgi:hypothetical protein